MSKYTYRIMHLPIKRYLKWWLDKFAEAKEQIFVGISETNPAYLIDCLRKAFLKFIIKGKTEQGENPSPTNPQEIINVEGKNLLNKANSEEGGIDSSGNLIAGSTLWRGTEYIKVKPNTKYTFSCNITMTLRLYQYNSNKVFLSPRDEDMTTTSFTITTGNTTEYLKWSIYKSGTTIMADIINDLKLQLEENSKATEYIPYSCIQINKCNKNLFDKDNANIYEGYFTPSSPVMTSNSAHRTVYIPCEPNTTYTVQESDKGGSERRFRVGTTETLPTTNVAVNQISDQTSSTYVTITTNANSKYLVVWCYFTYNTSITEEELLATIQIEKGSTATDYIAHQGKTYNFPLSTGQVLQEGDYLAEDGIHFVKTKTILNGTELWKDYSTQVEGYYKAYTTTKTLVANITGSNTKSNYFKVFPISDINSENVGLFGTQYGIYINVPNSIASNYTELAEWLTTHNVKIEYPRATESVVPYTQAQKAVYDEIISDGTYEGITNIEVTANINPDLYIEYYKSKEGE